MALSTICMGLAAGGYLTPTAGAITQEAINIAAVMNALRVGMSHAEMTDY